MTRSEVLEYWIGITIIVLLAIDVLLEWKMVYGVYPWEGKA